MLTCPQCNYENELGRIFCHQCGAKLDLDQIKPPSRGGKSLHRKKGGSAGRFISWTIRLVILGALILGLFLIAQVPDLASVPTTSQDIESFYRKRATLERASFGSQPLEVVVTTTELNAYLDNMQFEKPKGQGIALLPTNLQVDLGDDRATVTIVGKIQVGASWSKRLSISYTGRPTVEEGHFVYRPITARIGNLPVPLILLENTGMVQRYFGKIFKNMQAEERLLGRMSSIAVDLDQVILHYQPGGADVGE